MKKFFSLIIAVITAISQLGAVASAEEGNSTYYGKPEIKIKAVKEGFDITGEMLGGESMELAVEVCDFETYSEKNPIPSLVHRDQVSVDKTGKWSYLVNMQKRTPGRYKVKLSTTLGKIYEAECKYTGEDSSEEYAAIPRSFSFGADEMHSYYLGYGIKEGKYLIHFNADLGDKGESTARFLFYDSPKSNLWTGYDTFADLLRYDGGWGTGTERDSYSVTNVKAVEHGSEHTFDMWLDFDRQRIIYYMDGEYWETIRFDATSPEFWGFAFRTTNTEGAEALSLSDFRIIPYIYGRDDFGDYPMPEYITHTPDAYYTTENVGNIFYDPESISFDGQILNREKEKRLYNCHMEICDEDGNAVYSDNSVVELEAGEKKHTKLSIDMSRADKQYGRFIMKTSFESEGAEPVVTETEFLVVRKAETLNKKIGINVHFGHYMGDPEVNIPLLKNGGFSSARDFVDYNSYTGTIGFDRYNSWQGLAEESGIERLVILMGYDTETYGGVFPTTAEGRKNYTDYAVGVAEKLKGDAAVFELWNEMDWQTTSEQYALMLLDAVPAIKNVNATTKIAVMCPARVNGGERKWMKGVIDYIQAQGKNPAEYMDIVSVHPYTRNIIPEASECECGQETDSVGNLKDRVAAVRKMLDDEGLAEVGLISTEMGYYSTPGAVDSGRWNKGQHKDGITERQQADYSIRTIAMLHKELDHMQLYVINKTQRYDLSEDGFGMTESYFGNEIPYKGKPVYAAVSAFNSLLGNAEVVAENESEGRYDYVFKKPDGSQMHLMWTTNESDSISYTSKTGSVYVYDVYGNRTYVPCSGNVAEISVSGSPVYVEDTDFVVVDESNMEFNKDSTAVTAKVFTDYDTTEGESMRLICASFSDGVLISVEAKDITQSGMYETEAVNTIGADEVRAFLWMDMKPIDYRNIKIKR